jgi:hypothetical protein
MKIANELTSRFITAHAHVCVVLFKNPARLPYLLCLAPVLIYLALHLPHFVLPPKKPNNDHSNVIISIITTLSPSLHFLLSLSLKPLRSLSLSPNSQTKHRTQLSSIQSSMIPCKSKFSYKNRRFELGDCYCTTTLQIKWGCFRRVVALPLLPALGVTVLAPYPHLNPIVILFEGYTSSKVQCLTSVS